MLSPWAVWAVGDQLGNGQISWVPEPSPQFVERPQRPCRPRSPGCKALGDLSNAFDACGAF